MAITRQPNLKNKSVQRKLVQSKFMMSQMDHNASSSSSSQQSRTKEVLNAESHQQLMKALRIANLNATLLTAKLEVQSRNSVDTDNEYQKDVDKIFSNIANAMDIARHCSKERSSDFDKAPITRNSPLA
mmetsp:Transcript_12696/g.15280  ORF Transcript_12696/g.15280 Transcript_12696/m.15280 type:complete len:129 (-) Transcript_12696:197-583(-)|eukprot:CAMPEP_0195270412 /NCGR_PEP_ID=MMETSP0706-20130129/14342_1 /TAXON_ID=33640 /ORGANISM="Asterionellopsis glacialis, Strain CCMP134" /LENGTH=128 /DNA_ID=CAMNT_0040325693 /DNA_START=61 /DNA_END=447 /DNA_ORIENTATION=-